MRKILIIAKREYRAMVATKAFMITLVLMPILMGGGIFVQEKLRKHVNLDEKRMVVLDQTGTLFQVLSAAAEARNQTAIFDPATGGQIKPCYRLDRGPDGPISDEERLELSTRVRRGDIYAFVEIPKNIFALGPSGSAASAKFCAQNTVFSDEKGWLQQVLNDAVRRERLRLAKIDPEAVDRASAWVNVEASGLFAKASDGGKPTQTAARSEALSFLLPFGIMMLMFMVIMLAAQPMIESIMEERTLRIAEVLLGSVSPSQLMTGKLLGCVAGSLTVVVVYGIGGLGLAQYYHSLDMVPLGIVPWFLVYQVLAVLLFGSIFMAVGACVNDRKEAQGMLMPIMLLVVFPMFVWFPVVQQPTGTFAMWMSFVPPGTAMLMVLRIAASPDIPFWQPVVGVLILLAATGGCVFAAGRIFRIAILAQGRAPKLRQLWRWIVAG
jgi:ABC-2 type transport system permease protein